jgi:hypothetical protein
MSSNEDDTKYKDTKYQAYLDHYQGLINLEVDASNRFDKGILLLSGGGLMLSLTFIEKIAPTPNSDTVWILLAAWLFLIASLMSSLWSHLTSQSSMKRQRDILGKELYNENLPDKDKINKMATLTEWLNIISMVMFAAGVLFLCFFSYLNIPTKKKAEREVAIKATTTTTQTGK